MGISVEEKVPMNQDFVASRLGVLMSASSDARESWGICNPGGARIKNGKMHLFPRIVPEGNFSRISHAILHEKDDVGFTIERVGLALEPQGGVAILDLERPSRVLFRSSKPILTPELDYERNGTV
jgi:hypothetical protein